MLLQTRCTDEFSDLRVRHQLGQHDDVPEVEFVGYFGSALLALLRPVFIDLDVDGNQDVHWVTREVLILRATEAILEGFSLYSQSRALSSVLRWVALMSARTLDQGGKVLPGLRVLLLAEVFTRCSQLLPHFGIWVLHANFK